MGNSILMAEIILPGRTEHEKYFTNDYLARRHHYFACLDLLKLRKAGVCSGFLSLCFGITLSDR